jgi:hypothetical protein
LTQYELSGIVAADFALNNKMIDEEFARLPSATRGNDSMVLTRECRRMLDMDRQNSGSSYNCGHVFRNIDDVHSSGHGIRTRFKFRLSQLHRDRNF